MSQIERIAILGANSQIALDYIESSLENSKKELYLFSRNPMALKNLVDIKCISRFKFLGYDQFGLDTYDLIINFVGGSDPVLIASMGKDIFTITDHYDNLAISYLKKNNQCKYIFISSGAAYGDVFSIAPASELTKSNFNFNNLSSVDYYGAAKYIAEQRHRALSELNIVDIRIFSYISKRQNLDSELFLPQVIKSIKNKTEFLTSDEELWRDYIGPDDLCALIGCVSVDLKINYSLDCFTRAPISKGQILDMCRNELGLKVVLFEKLDTKLIQSGKKYYFSENRAATTLGYCPKYDSANLIRLEIFHHIQRINTGSKHGGGD